MAIYFQRKINKKITSFIYFLAQRTDRLFNFEFPRQLIFGLRWPEILSNLGDNRAIFRLWKVASFTLFMSASPLATAYGISIPNDPINDSVIVRLQTIATSPGDTEISNWQVQAGSTGFGPGQNDYFYSSIFEAPVMTPLDGNPTTNSSGVQGGTSNALVKNLPMNGDQVFLSIWIKRQDQSWVRELISVITASSSTTPTTKVENNRHSYFLFIFGQFVWSNTSMASHYQVWINDSNGTNVHKKWYRHEEVCIDTQAPYPDQCAASVPSISLGIGTFWVRAWNVHGGYGPWSNRSTFRSSKR